MLQVFLNVVEHGMTIQEAVNAPRIHHQWLPDQISVEPLALSADTQVNLEGKGHKIVKQSVWGAAEAILIGPKERKTGIAESSGNDAMAGDAPDSRDGSMAGTTTAGRPDRRPATDPALILSWTIARWPP